MKRLIALLLVLAVALSLGVSRGAQAEMNTNRNKSEQLLVRKTVEIGGKPGIYDPVGSRVFKEVTEYSYDEYGNETGETVSLVYPEVPEFFQGGHEIADYKYEYTDSGELKRVVTAGGTFNGIQTSISYEFENGVLVHERRYITSGDRTEYETFYEYGNDGQAVREENRRYGYVMINEWYGTPIVDLYEFDGKGYCSQWVHKENGTEVEYRYEYDDAGRFIHSTTTVNGQKHGEEKVRYNDAGLQTSANVVKDGTPVDYTFEYDKDGKLLSSTYDVNGDHVVIALDYNEDGFVSQADWLVNGSSVGKTAYQYTEKDGTVRGSFSSSDKLGPYLFGGGSYQGNVKEKPYKTSTGKPTKVSEYTLMPMGINIRYVKTVTEYEYENRMILAPTEEKAAPAAEPSPAAEAEETTVAATPEPVQDTDQYIPLTGNYREENFQNGTSSVFYLDKALESCSKVKMTFNIISASGSLPRSWELYVMDGNGAWHSVAVFRVTGTKLVKAELPEPMTVKALAVYPKDFDSNSSNSDVSWNATFSGVSEKK